MTIVHPLHGNQMAAVRPEDTVWLSASAGTGKTQVLSSRVLRLLLRPDVEPSQILCLTFTKAGATEMAERINNKLAKWVRLDDAHLAKELDAIGSDFGPDERARARTLFASVLDCPGGGLRIDTIHAFAQWLLGAFPQEAGLLPGSRPMEDRERQVLMRSVLADMLVEAEQNGDIDILSALETLSLRMAPDAVEHFLLRCADAREAWFGVGAWQEPLRPRINTLIGLASDADEQILTDLCSDNTFDLAALRRCHVTLAEWNTATGRDGATAISAWLSLDADARVSEIDDLHNALFTKTGTPRQLSNVLKRDPEYEPFILDVGASIEKVTTARALLNLAEFLTPALSLGRRFALAWDEAKQREGLVDFDDQIRRAAALLTNSDYSQWIGYKLDRRFDHILVDEAQDTNEEQWQIVNALTAEFFAGAGQHDDRLRTLFVVGDYKQAIFRFQGTSPENFEAARERVRTLMAGGARALQERGRGEDARYLQDLGLDRSFRTAQPVLDFVDQAIAAIGPASFGLKTAPDLHEGEKRPGYVALWRPIGALAEEEADSGNIAAEPSSSEEGEEGWLSRPDRQMADNIARQVRDWLDDGFPLAKGTLRRAGPGDVMVLVRKRRELAGLIVARLHAAGVPVAGVDRLRLGAPLAVRDLIAALRFAVQPRDDLSLAALLVSPLVGWTQDQLLQYGYRDKESSLWSHLRRSRDPEVSAAVAQLGELLARVDFSPPQALLHWLLVGPWNGRQRLVARLGREANDPINELLNAANVYSASATASIVGFLNWFDAGDGELKRESAGNEKLVRVMTVHGSKGLQAPIVILADAASDPERSRSGQLELSDPRDPKRSIPLPSLKKEERAGRIADEHEANRLADEQEHWRLLYVAMTRAEEALFIGGALGTREKQPSERSWYARLQEVFDSNDWASDAIWGGRLEFGALPSLPASVSITSEDEDNDLELPSYLLTELRPEPRPPRPLAPSSLAEDFGPEPPNPANRNQFSLRRGVLIHKLLERLPDVASSDRRMLGWNWLEANAADFTDGQREDVLTSALTVLENPDWGELFGPESLSEAPIAGLVGDKVVAGTIDRLLIRRKHIRLIDFKTTRQPPNCLEAVPDATLRQMAAYVAALEAAYPGRRIEAAVLYTETPGLLEIPAATLAARKRSLLEAQESF